MPGPQRFRAFAVEDTSVQLAWGGLPAGRHEVEVGDVGAEVDAGAGTWWATGLRPGTAHEVRLDGRAVATATTLEPPPGRPVARIATVSDTHLGEEGFGIRTTIREPAGVEPYPVRCLRAALDAALAWGAELVVVKGDLTQRAQPDELEAAAALLAGVPVPVVAVPGNHEVKKGSTPWAPPLRAAGVRTVEGGAEAVDLPGLRVVVADTTVPTKHHGRLTRHRVDEVVALAAGGDRPSLVCLHHQLARTRVPTTWPPGVPSGQAGHLLGRLADEAPATWVTSGHTHRNRAWRHRTVQVTEVGSTKDFPGGWAGYVAHEGGLRQVVAHVTGDGTDAWLDRTRWAALGAWGRWSPGRLEDRCLTTTWSS